MPQERRGNSVPLLPVRHACWYNVPAPVWTCRAHSPASTWSLALESILNPMTERIFVALDLETTGLDPQKDTIIEIGAVRFQGDRILDRFSSLVNPGRKIPLRIQQITGITDRDVVNAPTLAQIAPEILAFVDSGVSGMVAHNASFDLGFMDAANIRFHRPGLDTFELSTILLPGMASYSLGELCRVLGIDLQDAHRALDDAEASARLFMLLNGQIQRMDGRILAQIHAAGEEVEWPPMLLFDEEVRRRQTLLGDDWLSSPGDDDPPTASSPWTPWTRPVVRPSKWTRPSCPQSWTPAVCWPSAWARTSSIERARQKWPAMSSTPSIWGINS